MKPSVAILLPVVTLGLVIAAFTLRRETEEAAPRSVPETLDAFIAEFEAADAPGSDPDRAEARERLIARYERVCAVEERRAVPAGLGSSEGVGFPYQWVPSMRADLEAALAERGFWFDEVEAILEEARGLECLGARAGLRSEPASLLLTRHGVNLLCARAVARAAREQTRSAIDDLESALDLARLTDGGLLIDAMIRGAVDAIVLSAVTAIVDQRRRIGDELARFVFDHFRPDDLVRRAQRHLVSEARFMKRMREEAPEDAVDAIDEHLRGELAGMRAALRALAQPDAVTRSAPWSPFSALRENLALRWMAHAAIALDRLRRPGHPLAVDLSALNAHLPAQTRLTHEIVELFDVEVETYSVRLALRSRAGRRSPGPSAAVWCL